MPRPGNAANGYGEAHRRLRRLWASRVALGTVPCARCRKLIVPGMPWDLDHDDEDRSRYLGPSHRRCNRSNAGLRARPSVERFSREW